jgi:hypothetical protein
MRTYPLRNETGVLFAFEVDAPLLGRRLARVLADTAGVSDARRRRWWRGSSDVHIRFRYHEREFIVWEPFGDNGRWWIGPDEGATSGISLAEVERAVASR